MRSASGPLRRRWRALAPRERALIGVVLLVLGVSALVAALGAAFPGPGGPPSSSYATAPDGAAAYAELLAESGHPVERLREPPAEGTLDPSATVVLLEPDAVLPDEAAALRRFVEAGGRLVAGGPVPAWVEELLDDPPAWSGEAVDEARVLAPVQATAGVDTVRSAGRGSWEEPGGTLPVLGSEERALLVTGAPGRGTVALLADVSPLQNARLEEADNAALGIALAGEEGRPVHFQEAVHGFGVERGLAALPGPWKVALAGLLLAALLWMLARGRRLGPPEEEARPLPPPRAAYVEALASVLARTGRPAEAAAPVREAARRRLAARAGLRAEAGDSELTRAAEELGLPERERRAIVGETTSEADALQAGRALARLEGAAR